MTKYAFESIKSVSGAHICELEEFCCVDPVLESIT